MEKEEKPDEITDNEAAVRNDQEKENILKVDSTEKNSLTQNEVMLTRVKNYEDISNGPTTDTDTVASDNSQAAVAMETSAASDVATNSKEPKVKLIKKLNSLQEKAKNLREKLGRGFGPKTVLKQQEELVQQSEISRRQNDAHAALSMSKISTATSGSNQGLHQAQQQEKVETNRNSDTRKRCETDTSSCCSNDKLTMQQKPNLSHKQQNQRQQHQAQQPQQQQHRQQQQAQQNQQRQQQQAQQKQQKAAAKPKRKTRNELEGQLQDMRDLLHQLRLQGPLFDSKVRQLVQSNKKFKKLDIFTPDAAGVAPLCLQATFSRDTEQKQSKNRNLQMRHDSERSSVSSAGGKQRQDSVTSNASTVNNSNDGQPSTSRGKTDDSKESNDIKNKRRRTRRAQKNKGLKEKTQESEQELLAKYLKSIVEKYLGEKQADKLEEFTYKPDVEDLETYAQRLVQAGMGRIVEDEIRVNRKNNRQSFITMSNDREATQRDGIIMIPVARRYAFEGDIVRAFVMHEGVAVNNEKPEDKEKMEEVIMEPTITGGKDHSFCIDDDELDHITDEAESPDSDADPNELDATLMATSDGCPKAFVIDVVKKTEKREVVGTISFKNATKLNDNKSYYKLKPHDMRVPMVYVPVDSCADKLTADQKNDICGFLYVVRVLHTDVHGHCIGELDQPVGKVGDLEAEIKAILLHNRLKDVRPYEERFNEMFAQPDPPISSEDLKHRADLRKKCIFTIDPLTARDLDDAMSIEKIEDELYEVGVHISDVSHYLHEDCELDNIVKLRATSIYLVTEVIHMLPQPLCFKCSLLPGEDKFAFSVFWRMRLNGEIVGEPRFTRSVINSCSQFAYEHAQKIIDNPSESFDADDFPTICNGFTPSDLAWRVLIMDKIAKCLRGRRYDGGALSINNPKLRFTMNPQTGEPISYEVDARQDANFLIEEFMLLANQSVARFIHEYFPQNAILRNHAPPLSKSLKSLKEKLATFGFEFDWSNSKTIYDSMQKICATAKDPLAMEACLSTLLTKPMARAKYFCSEGKTEEADLWHYALSIPIYTHFTSPIRRYPDILVHRLLAAALNYCPPPKRTPDELHVMAKVCNEQKFNAKSAGEESTNLFFKRYIKLKQSITLRAVVTEIFQHIINVVTIETGHNISINYKMQKLLVDTSNAPAFILISEKNSKNSPVKLQMFSSIDVKLVIWDDKVCGFFVTPDPKQRQINSIEASKKKQQQQQQYQQQKRKQKQNGANNGAIPKTTNGIFNMNQPIKIDIDDFYYAK